MAATRGIRALQHSFRKLLLHIVPLIILVGFFPRDGRNKSNAIYFHLGKELTANCIPDHLKTCCALHSQLLRSNDHSTLTVKLLSTLISFG